MVEMEKRKFEKMVKELGSIKGRHTELVSVYVPKGYNIQKAIDQLRTEQSTAQNIKSKAVRKNVMAALEKILQHLKVYKKTPENGLAVFCGNVSDKEGVSDIQIFVITPIEDIKTKLYQCDQHFVIDPLMEMIEEKEVYGLVILDKSEANIGFLKGKKVESVKHMESIVPGKTKKGGWCVHEDTLLTTINGDILPVKDLGEKHFFAYDFKQNKAIKAKHNHYFKRSSSKAFKIVTKAPRIEITATPEHRFFTITENGIIDKHLSDLTVGDRLIAMKRVNVKGKPSKSINQNFAQFLGYLLGDCNIENNRVVLYDADLGLLKNYKKIAKSVFKLEGVIKHRENKGYYQLRLYSKKLVNELNKNFPEIVISYDKDISPKILKLDNKTLASFVKGLFDAEAYVQSGSRVGITMNRKTVIASLQQTLLRFGIMSSFREVKGKSFAKKQKYSLTIDDKASLENFSKFIGFSGKKKKQALAKAIKSRKPMSRVDQVPVDGRYVRSRVKSLRMTSADFPEAGTVYLLGNRFMSPKVFKKNIITKIESRVSSLKIPPKNLLKFRELVRIQYKEIADQLGLSASTIHSNMKNGWNTKPILKVIETERKKMIKTGNVVLKEFNKLINSDSVSVKIHSITKVPSRGLFYDMEVDKYQNFIANGLVLHNSANRFARIREGLLEDFMKTVGEAASKEFLAKKDLRGIIIGGPGPIKEMFYESEYLNYQIKKQVLGTVDTSYTGDYGMKEMVERSEELISQASAIKENKLLERFFTDLAKDTGLAVYGEEKTLNLLGKGAVDILLISESFYKNDEKKTEKIIEDAENMGTKVEMVSTESKRGNQLKELGGIGGILRYKA